MKRTLLLVAILTATTGVAVERKQLMPLIESAVTNRGSAYAEVLPLRPPGPPELVKAATNQESAYVQIRNKIVEYGKEALPLLAEIAVDESLPWQQQLVARICYERIKRKEDIDKLLAIDWYKYPNFGVNGINITGGLVAEDAKTVMSHLMEQGLWNYYLEVEWKATGEVGTLEGENWFFCCTRVVKDSPERAWFLKVCDDLLVTAPPPQLRRLSNILAHEEKSDTIDLREKYRSKLSVLTSPSPSYRDLLEARKKEEGLLLPTTP